MSHLFISYARADVKIVRPIAQRIQAAGHQIWIDEGKLRIGETYREKLAQAIRDAAAFVIMVSPRSVRRRNVEEELSFARDCNKEILPVYLEATELSDGFALIVGPLHRIEMGRDGEAAVESLLSRLSPYPADAPAVAQVDKAAHGWRSPRVVLPASAVLAAVALLGGPATLGPLDAPTSLSSAAVMGPVPAAAVAGLAFAAFGAFVAFAFRRVLSPVIGGLAAFLAATWPLAIWTEQYLAGALASAAAAALMLWRRRRPRAGGLGLSLAHAALLVSAVAAGIGTDFWLDRSAPSRVVGITSLEADDDPALLSSQTDLSIRLQQNLAAALSQTGVLVRPIFDAATLQQWTFDRWRSDRGREIKPALLFKNTLSRCTSTMSEAAEARPVYVLLSEPYGANFRPLQEFVQESGADARTLPLAIAFELISVTSDYLALDEPARQSVRRYFADQILSIARARQLPQAIERATSLGLSTTIDDDEIATQLTTLLGTSRSCDTAAATNRSAQAARIMSFSGETG
jgi:TIR domain